MRPLTVMFAERPVALALTVATLLLVGIFAFLEVPVASVPDVEYPTIVVSTILPGASPDTMAESVAAPLETYLGGIDGVKSLTSTNIYGESDVIINFDLNRDINSAAQDVQAAINQAVPELPSSLPAPPTYKKINPTESPIAIYSVQSDALSLTELEKYTENVISPRIARVDGVSHVSLGGMRRPSIHIRVDPRLLAQKGMDLQDVAQVIEATSLDAPKGSIGWGRYNYSIYANDQLTTPEAWRASIITYRNGKPVTLGDIADVNVGAENEWRESWQNGKPGYMLLIYKRTNANVLSTISNVRNALPRILEGLPASITVSPLVDRSLSVRSSLRGIEYSLAASVVCVLLVVFLFTSSLRGAVIPALAVPISLLGAVVILVVLGKTLDTISLMGLTVAAGFVVDDAIVVQENIQRIYEKEGVSLRSTSKGLDGVSFTVFSMSLSLLAVFVPVIFLDGILGRLFREFSICVVSSIVFSMLVSLMIVPAMSYYSLRTKTLDTNRIASGRKPWLRRLRVYYGKAVLISLNHPGFVLTLNLGILLLSIFMVIGMPKDFFPSQDNRVLIGISVAPEDTSYSSMVTIQQRLMQLVASDPDVAGWGDYVGGSQQLNNGFAYVTLKDKRGPEHSIQAIVSRLRLKLKDIQGVRLYLRPLADLRVAGILGRTEYNFTLQSSSINDLNKYSKIVTAALKSDKSLRDVSSDLESGATKLVLHIDRSQAEALQVSPERIDEVLYDAFGQNQLTQYFTGANAYKVILEAKPDLQRSVEILHMLWVTSSSGKEVPLDTLVSVSKEPGGNLSINHMNGLPVVDIGFDVAPGVSLSEAMDGISNIVQRLNIPDSVIESFEGTAQEFSHVLRREAMLGIAALLCVYVILGVLYEDFFLPLVVISTIPSAIVGALVLIYFEGFDIDVIVIMGFLLLMGIVKKNAIMLVDFARKRSGVMGGSARGAIYRAAMIRFRPVFMTTMVALCGAIPLVLDDSLGHELREPLGYTMIGGLLFSQIFSSFSTPAIYLIANRLSVYGSKYMRLGKWSGDNV